MSSVNWFKNVCFFFLLETKRGHITVISNKIIKMSTIPNAKSYELLNDMPKCKQTNIGRFLVLLFRKWRKSKKERTKRMSSTRHHWRLLLPVVCVRAMCVRFYGKFDWKSNSIYFLFAYYTHNNTLLSINMVPPWYALFA